MSAQAHSAGARGSRIGPGALAERLLALELAVERVTVRAGAVPVPSYPGGLRPTAIVEIAGAGSAGFGECVAFSEQAQHAFQARAEALLAHGTGPLGGRIAEAAEPFERAALEGALLDLGLRQRRLSLSQLCGPSAARLRWVCSFAACDAPHARMQALRASGAGDEFKVDVDPAWSARAIAALAGAPGLRILDFKQGGSAGLCAELARAVPDAVFEDPPDGCTHRSVALDRPLRSVHDAARALAAGRALNLKAPRMGGFVPVLRALELALHGRALAYFGGMFEVGPGREQARALAALFCGSAPNDLAPLAGGACSLAGPSPSTVRLDHIGFGAAYDWRALTSQLA